MLVGKQHVLWKLFKKVKTVKISGFWVQEVTILKTIIVYTGRRKGIAGKKNSLAVRFFTKQTIMIERLAWKIKKSEFKIFPGNFLAFLHDRQVLNRAIGQARHTIRSRVFENTFQFFGNVNRDNQIL